LRFGVPEIILNLTAATETLGERLMKNEEKEPPLTEEDGERIKEFFKKNDEYNQPILEYFEKNYSGRCNCVTLATDDSLETTTNKLQALFNPQILLVNHDQTLNTHTTCCNLSLKHNMLYLSVYQVIKEQIASDTEFGRKLLLTKRDKKLDLNERVKDEFEEGQYSPADTFFGFDTIDDLNSETVIDRLLSDETDLGDLKLRLD
jgi:hypothetical protein